ncbi:ribose-5-phosphate isomerase RpiA [Urbifossiella limnaea]|uniref:Ribose 5-phosphate isomerase A n=1 Tax=Urbifossiella limnaea TaxID=2528023 RepID=A0A517XPE6_9BACT|nr:ribose-5-phosphate isomerase RpiA [Urbifossiella limnaea]QDU19378.1 Ribose-5-phosphate isomerase A [Urbifossiella limnaea]
MTNVEAALALVADGMTLGLGSGKASEKFIAALGDRVRAGLRVRGVPTSRGSAELAARVGVPLVELADGLPLDITFDGADEVDPQLNLLKGYGNALVREKVVAAASGRLVILVGPERSAEKLVPALGSRGKLPVEVVAFALPLVADRLARLGYPADPLRTPGGDVFLSDNGNPILHARVGPLADPGALDRALHAVPGVVDTGLFLGMAERVIVQHEDGRVETRTR